MGSTPRRWGVPPELGVAALVGAASLPLGRLFLPGELYGDVMTALACSLTLAWAMRRGRVPLLVALGLSWLGLLWFVTFRFHPDTMWGPLPSPDSLSAIAEAVRLGSDQMMEKVAPVEPTASLLMFVVTGVWLTAWLSSVAATALANPVLSIAAAVPLFILPGALEASRRLWLDAVAFLLGAAWVMYDEQRNRAQRWAPAESMHASGWRVGPALRVLGVGALVVALLTPALPGFGGRPILDHAGPGARVFFNPLVAIKPTLDTAGERTLFTVRADRQTYYRLTSLDVFDGEVWKQRDRRLNVPIGRRFGTVPTGDSIAGDVVQQTFTIVALAGPWLPAAYDPLAVSANVGDLRFESGPRAIIRPGGLTEGLSYTVESNVAEPDATVLDVPVTYNSVVLADYLRLPRDTPRSVHREARRIAGKERTPFRQALALQNHLRTFTYDEKVAAGHSFKTLTEFLTKTKRGYCEQFAGAMAVMARALGIPSRVAIGFGYGRFRGEDAVRITTEQAHAWVEIYFPQTGWIPFEPTPRAGVAQVPDYADRPDPVTPTTEPSVRPTASVSPSPDARGRNPEEDTGVGGGTDALLSAGMNLVLGIGVLAVLAAIVIAIATIRRRRRIALAPDARAAVSRRYVDFLTWCAGAGLGRASGETPLQHALRLGAQVEAAEGPLRVLAGEVDEALWAPPNGLKPEVSAGAAREAQRALSATLPRRKRVRAALRLGRPTL